MPVAPTPRHLRRLVAPALAATLALLPAACSLETGADTDPQLVDQWVVATEPAPAPGTPPTVTLQGGASLVGVSGEFVRTCTLGTPRVTYALSGTSLTFRAIFTPAPVCATEAPTRQLVRYYAYLTRVTPGTYQVRVIHENDDLVGGTGTVLEQNVIVP